MVGESDSPAPADDHSYRLACNASDYQRAGARRHAECVVAVRHDNNLISEYQTLSGAH
jgi:hypothetical protein